MTTAIIAIYDKATNTMHMYTKHASSWGWKDFAYWGVFRHCGREHYATIDRFNQRLSTADGRMTEGLAQLNEDSALAIGMQLID